jgi:DNA-binding CsgD family transcriptional regulator
MTRLSHSDWERLSGFLRRLYAQTDLDQLPCTMLEGLRGLIDCEHAGYNEVNAEGTAVIFSLSPWVQEIVNLAPAASRHLAHHPQLSYFRTHTDRTPRQTFDFMSAREFRALPIYQEFFRHADTGNQLVMPLSDPGAPLDMGFTLNRKRGSFSQRDASILHLAREHMVQARQNAIVFTQTARQASRFQNPEASLRAGTVMLDPDGRPNWLTPSAIRLLETYYPGSLQRVDGLPESVGLWVRANRAALRDRTVVTTPIRPLVSIREHSRLTIRFQADNTAGARLLLSEESHAAAPASLPLELTSREAEVLHWMIEGKTNPEIAIILHISPRTVHKHVEHLFDKLGVSTRQAAARQAQLFLQ